MSRELKEGKNVCIGGRTYKSAKITKIKGKDGKEKIMRSRDKTCMVPESVIEAHKLSDDLFIKTETKQPERQKAKAETNRSGQ